MSATRRYRLAIAARVLGGTVGGYGCAVAVAMAMARALPGARSEAVVWATLAGMLAMPAAAIWMFGVRDLRKAWGWLALVIGAASLCAWTIGGPA